MSTTEELAQSHNGIGGSSPMIADNLSTRHEPVVKNSLMNSQEDGPRPVENEVSPTESSRTQDQDAKNEVPKAEEKSTDAKKDEESTLEKREGEEPIQKVTVSLLTASVPKSDEKEKPTENSAAHEQKAAEADQPMDVDQPKEKTLASAENQESADSAEKSDEKDKKESKTDESDKTEDEKSAEEQKEIDSEDKSKEESGAAAEPEEKSRKRGAGRKPASSRSAKKTKTSESGGDEETSTTPKKESPKRGQRKAEKTKEGDETEGEDAESASKEEKTPLLEAPLIVEGKRSRQRTERLDSNVLVTPLQKDFEIPEGRGTKLGDIEFIDATISKTPTTDLKILHKLIYGRVGTTPAEIKKNLRLFCGFEFTETSKEYEKKKKSLDHLVMKDTKTVCKLLGLEVGGRKDDLVDTLLNFLIEPKDKGKKLPATPTATKRKRASTPSSSRKRSAGKRASSSRKAKKAGDKSEASEEDEEEAIDEEGGESEAKSHTEGEEPSEEEEPSPKKAKRNNKPAPTPASTSKRGQPSRSARKAPFPSDTDIKAAIKELLKGVNLEEVTMKEMTTKVYDKFPNVDLTSKKDFIKETVKALLSSSD